MCSHHLVAHVDLGEAEGAEMRVGALHRRLNGLPEQLVHKLADERPHLLHRLREERERQKEVDRYITSKSHMVSARLELRPVSDDLPHSW